MKFFGTGVVWDKEKDKALCRFVDGEYDTKVKREQDILKKLELEYEETDDDKGDKQDDKEEQPEKEPSKKAKNGDKQ